MSYPDMSVDGDPRGAVDPGAQQVAGVYARALLGAGKNGGDAGALVSEFEELVSEVLQKFPEFDALLSSPRLDADEKARILDRTLGGQASALALNVLKVLARHGRLPQLRAIVAQARHLYELEQGRRRVDVTTAVPLGDDQVERLRATLAQRLGLEPQLVRHTDPDMIGGLVVRVGDTVLDGSVATRLSRLRGQMIERSVHEIQRRRDRVSHPAGN